MNIDEIYFARKDEYVKLPTKREEDGCYDIYAHIVDELEIPPHTNRLVPTGLYSAFSPKYRIGIRERGSNTKTNMITMAGQIDSGYRGEWFVSIYNGNDAPIVLSNTLTDSPFDTKIGKHIITKYVVVNLEKDKTEYNLPFSAVKKDGSDRHIGCIYAATEDGEYYTVVTEADDVSHGHFTYITKTDEVRTTINRITLDYADINEMIKNGCVKLCMAYDIEYPSYCILISTSKAIAQFAVELVPNVTVKEVPIEEIQNVASERGSGALGSSNK